MSHSPTGHGLLIGRTTIHFPNPAAIINSTAAAIGEPLRVRCRPRWSCFSTMVSISKRSSNRLLLTSRFYGGTSLGVTGIGYEIDRELIAQSKRKAIVAGVNDLVRFEQVNLLTADLSKANVITVYLLPDRLKNFCPSSRNSSPDRESCPTILRFPRRNKTLSKFLATRKRAIES